MRSSLVVAAAVLAVTLLYLAWPAPAGGPATPESSPPAAGEPAAASRASPVTGNAPVDSADARRADVVARPSGTSPEKPLRVRVHGARDGRAVAGAVVRTLAAADPDDVDRAGWYSELHVDVEALATALGAAATTGPDGTALLLRPAGDASLRRRTYVARAGDRYGEATLADPGGDELTIEVDVDRSARVLVVDAAGEPAAGVRVRHDVRVASGGLGTTARSWIARSGDDGVAVFPHTQLRQLADEQVSEVAIDEPGVDVVPLPLDVYALSRVPIRLVLPPTGRVTVAVAADGRRGPFDHGGLALRADGGDGRAFLQPCEGAPVTYPWVGLGRRFAAELWTPAGRRGPFAFDGPHRAGEGVTFTIPASDAPLLRLRVLGADRRPLARTVVDVDVAGGADSSTSGTQTDADGVLAVALPADWRGRALGTVGLAVRFGADDGARAQVDGAGRVLQGVVDLGDVAVGLPDLWAGGRLVDENGAPLASFEPAFLDLPWQVVDAAADAAPPRLRKLDGGRVELRGGAGVRRVRFSGGRALATPRAEQLAAVDVERGADDFVLRFRRLGELEVRLVHAPQRTCAVAVALVGEDGERVEPFPFPRAVDGGSAYRFDGVRPGRYRCTVTLLGERTPLWSVDDVVVGPGANADPRLRDVVLPGVRILRVDLVSDAGRPRDDVREASVYVRDGDRWAGRWFVGSRVDLGVRGDAVDLVVVVPGSGPVRLTGVQHDVQVRLAPLATCPVVVEVVGGDAPPGAFQLRAIPIDDGGERFVVESTFRGRSEDAAPWLTAVMARSGRPAPVAVDGPGRYRLEVAWWPQDGEAVAVTPNPAVLTVGGPAAAPRTVRVSADQLAR
jgi:hypothetical protein